MKRFLTKHASDILGVVSGFDRMIFRGSIRQLMYQAGMSTYLYSRGILLKEFKNYAPHYSNQIKVAAQEYASSQCRPFEYLSGNNVSKEKMARDIMVRDGIKEGLVCVMSVLEPCYSYKVVGNRATEKLEIKPYFTKCLHIYHYWNDPTFGLVHGRIQTWYPFNMQFYVNGRELLKNQMDSKNILYTKADNCFTWVSDLRKANVLAQKQLDLDWNRILDKWATAMNPIHDEIFPFPMDYYWTLAQSEWASDILFKDSECLAKIYPDLIHHSMVTFQSKDVMRFLGKRLTLEGNIPGRFNGEVITNLKDRTEGMRVKHSINANSLKIYDKQGSVLRIEVTINNPSEFKSYRPNLSTGELTWQPMRKSIDDIHRRADVSQKSINRHLNALSSANTGIKFSTIIDDVAFPIRTQQIKSRGLAPFTKDKDILDIIINGKYHINGFRNRDIRQNLFSSKDSIQAKKDSAKISRYLRLLRHHGLIKKVPKTHRYMVTDKGVALISAIKTIRNATVSDIFNLAA